MNPTEPPDETELLRDTLRRAGFTPSTPEQYGVTLRAASSFTHPADPFGGRRAERNRRGGRWQPWAAAAAVAAVALGAGVAALDRRDAPPPSAASPASDEVTADAPYWRVDSLVRSGADSFTTRSVWLGRDRPGRLVENESVSALPPASFGLLVTEFSWDELQALPTDPALLRELLENEVRASGPERHDHHWQVARLAGELLVESPTPTAVRQATWRMLTQLPGAVLVDSGQDSDGRRGQKVTFRHSEGRSLTYVMNVRSGALLEMTLTAPSGEEHRTTILRETGVTSLPPADSLSAP